MVSNYLLFYLLLSSKSAPFARTVLDGTYSVRLLLNALNNLYCISEKHRPQHTHVGSYNKTPKRVHKIVISFVGGLNIILMKRFIARSRCLSFGSFAVSLSGY